MKRIIFTSLLFVMAMISQAGNRPDVEGTIVDNNGAVLPFANVVLLTADSTFVQGATSNENGVFQCNPSMRRRASTRVLVPDRMPPDE